MRKKGISYKNVTILILLICNCALANRIIHVDNNGPGDFNNIQAAIDDANDGDTILVADGTYTGDGNRDIDFKGKAITLKSQNGPKTCIIYCQGKYYWLIGEKTSTLVDEPHRGFLFSNNENASSIIDGFTVTNGLFRQQSIYKKLYF